MSRRLKREERPELPIHRRELIDAADVGRLMGCSRSTVLELRRQGWLPKPLRLAGGVVRWRVRELADWIDAGCPMGSDWFWKPTPPITLETLLKALRDQVADLERQAEARRRVDADEQVRVGGSNPKV